MNLGAGATGQSGEGDAWRVVDDRTDGELLAAIQGVDEAALRQLYDRHAPWLLARLQARTPNRDAVDQALQDTFLAVWRRPGSYRGDGEVGAWLWGIAIRRLITQMRPVRYAPWQPADHVPSAEDGVLAGLEHGDVGVALGRLSPELQAVIRATVLDGLTSREAGRLLGLPTGTVKTRRARAVRQLREALT